VRRILTGLVVVSAVLTGLAWREGRLELFLGPAHLTVSAGAKPVVLTLLLLVARLAMGWRGAAIAAGLRGVVRSNVFRKPALGLLGLVVFFGGAEVVLRVVGFEAALPKIVIRGERGSDGTDRFLIPDPELRWRLNPGVEYNGRTVNSLGFFDREVQAEKPRGVMRVICLGDSCTAQGIPPYAGFLHERLQSEPPTAAPWEAFNTGVHGYSSVQGLRQFQILGRTLSPDVVTVYYGWNDHWLGDLPDSEVQGWGMSAMAADVVDRLRDSRLFQAMVHMLKPPPRRNRSVVPDGDTVLRVPPEEYAWTLGQLIREIRALDAVPILMTAPRAEALTSLLVRNGQTEDLAAVIRLHDEYAAITRDVAAREDARLLDLAALFAGPEAAPLFSDDGIHLQRAGRIRIAEELHRLLTEMAAAGELPGR
jgi:lysophospholipase L1-like esterase